MSDSQSVEEKPFSFTQNDLLCSLYYLSNCNSQKEEAGVIKKSLDFFQGFDRDVFLAYFNTFTSSGKFPEFFHFVMSNPLLASFLNKEAYVPESVPKFKSVWKDYVLASERQAIEALLPYERDFQKKQDMLKRLSALFQGDNQAADRVLLSSANIDVLKSALQRKEEGSILFPVSHINDMCGSMGPGTCMSILGNPASGKTTLALNIAFLNSIVGNKKTLYFYLEDMPERYQYNLFSRFSYHIGDKVPSVSLKRGVDESDRGAVDKITEIQNRYRAEQKGVIHFVSMNDLSPDPEMFARKMASLVDRLDIDIIITDYIQKTKTYMPKGWSSMDYMNQIASTLSLISLGLFGNRKCVSILLSQLNRESENRVLKNRGRMTMFDGAEVHSIERDSFVVLGVFSDQAMRDAGEASIQLLKNRDNSSDVTPEVTTFDPAYCYLGDVRGLESVYSNETMESIWDSEYKGL